MTLEKFVEIALGIGSADFKHMAASYSGRWDLVQLRCANFMACTLEERVALILLELSENFGTRHGKSMRVSVPALLWKHQMREPVRSEEVFSTFSLSLLAREALHRL